MSPDMNPSLSGLQHDEVVAALARVAIIALSLAAVVLATRAAQVSFDRSQAARARMEAVASSQQRLRTLADRNLLYRTAAADTSATLQTSDGFVALAASPSMTRQRWCDAGDSHDASLGGDPCNQPDAAAPAAHGSGASDSCNTPPAAPPASGPTALLAAAASALLHRCHAQAGCSTQSSGTCSSASTQPRSIGSGTSNNDNTTASTTVATAAPAARWDWDLDCSLSGQRPAGGSAGGGVSPGLRLQHLKGSDSLLETCRVLASVPQDTITSTRQVLATFNYDYSALHRRESSYVSGSSSSWRTRTHV
ncbi:hypothetical protein PLESTB_001409400 [Pleodorina starrii]|uniref:Uncharacterized protein n=1 Tax=Pleodorina starrii TaxID=330485 RepID=A0A9W6BVZ7_9CHLO|nr:hypothetical protein PLESTM_002002600 [Pleodorina starrii]GLC58865.1 hypothetical protein PLESTB_001409400 [Pleodorina starrii]GLC68045.1 hypothetical protein PLESTF_000639000 [Pleodorina starrii]